MPYERSLATTSSSDSDEDICEIHAQYGGYGYVVTTRPGGDNRLHVEDSGCDRDAQVVVEVSGQVPVDELEVVARLLAGAARLRPGRGSSRRMRDCNQVAPSAKETRELLSTADASGLWRDEHSDSARSGCGRRSKPLISNHTAKAISWTAMGRMRRV
jgi:hypothetical protein